MKNEESLYIRVIKTALKYPKGFNYWNIVEDTELNLEDWEKGIVERNFQYACWRYNASDNTKGETIFLFIVGKTNEEKSAENKYLLTLEAEFSYIDYQELKFARENAETARRQSKIAIIIALATLVISAILPFLVATMMTQTVKLEEGQSLKIDGGQFNEIQKLIELDTKK